MNCEGGKSLGVSAQRNPSLLPSSCFLSFKRNTARNGEGGSEREVTGEETLERARRQIL